MAGAVSEIESGKEEGNMINRKGGFQSVSNLMKTKTVIYMCVGGGGSGEVKVAEEDKNNYNKLKIKGRGCR